MNELIDARQRFEVRREQVTLERAERVIRQSRLNAHIAKLERVIAGRYRMETLFLGGDHD